MVPGGRRSRPALVSGSSDRQESRYETSPSGRFAHPSTLIQGLKESFILRAAPDRQAEETLIQPPEIAGVPNHDAVGQHLLPQGGRGHPRPGEFHQEIIHHAGKRGQPRRAASRSKRNSRSRWTRVRVRLMYSESARQARPMAWAMVFTDQGSWASARRATSSGAPNKYPRRIPGMAKNLVKERRISRRGNRPR